MQSVATSFDIFTFGVHYTVGYYDMFKLPLSTSRLGGSAFVIIYAFIVLLFGIPSFTDEVSYLMPSECRSRCFNAKKWFRSYEIIALLQTIQLAVSESQEKLGLAVTQIFTLLHYRNIDLLPLFSQNCRFSSFVNNSFNETVAVGVTDLTEISDKTEFKLQERLLQPSCLRRPRSEIGCIMHMLFSSSADILSYSIIMLSVIIVCYAIIFGRSMRTYGKIGRVYVTLVVLCIATLMFHFVGKNSAPVPESRYVSHSKEIIFSNGLVLCIFSLGINHFQIAALGARVGKDTKQNFVLLAISMCVVDFAISTAFTGLSYLRQSAVEYLCDEFTSGLFDYEIFMSLPDTTTKIRNSTRVTLFAESAIWGSLQMSESLLMFRETSGSVPWTVYLPFQGLIMLFSVFLVCIHFVLCDLQASRLFKVWWAVIGLALFRIGLLLSVIVLRMFNYAPKLPKIMTLSVPVSFLCVKMFECVTIHLGQGFSKYIENRRGLLRERQKFQLFIFDWYLAPSIMFLYNIGYPVACVVLVMVNKESLMTLQFFVYFLFANILPAIAVIVIVHFRVG